MKLIFFILCLSHSLLAQAMQEEKNLTEESKLKKLKIYALSDWMTAKNSTTGESLSGFGLGVMINYGLTKKYGVAGSIRQSFTSLGGNASITVLDVRGTWAITGSLLKEEKSISLENKKVVHIDSYGQEGWRAQAFSTQYYFNGSSSSVPFSGFGVSGYYEQHLNELQNLIYGLKVDSLSNASTNITPLSVFIGWGVWL